MLPSDVCVGAGNLVNDVWHVGVGRKKSKFNGIQKSNRFMRSLLMMRKKKLLCWWALSLLIKLSTRGTLIPILTLNLLFSFNVNTEDCLVGDSL